MDILFVLNVVQTVLLFLATAGIGFLVYRSARTGKGTRRSLHTRRQEVFNDVVRVLTLLSKTGELRREELLDFRSRTQDAAVLFDPEIAGYIDEIYNRGVKVISTNELLQAPSLPIGEERDHLTVENAKHAIWLADQISLVGKRFSRYPDVRQEPA